MKYVKHFRIPTKENIALSHVKLIVVFFFLY